jgi:hypothetical protein
VLIPSVTTTSPSPVNLWQDQYIRFPSSPQSITRWRLLTNQSKHNDNEKNRQPTPPGFSNVRHPSSLKTTISTFFLYFVTPPNKNHRLYLWLINSFPPHITHVFDSRSFLLSSYHASPISKLPTIPNSFIINIWHPKTPPVKVSRCCNPFLGPRKKKRNAKKIKNRFGRKIKK